MSRPRSALGIDPLDMLLGESGTTGRSQGPAVEHPSHRKVRATFHLPYALVDEARNATVALSSLLAELGEPEAIRKEVMGHRDLATTQRYTHLRPVHEIPAHERLANAVPIADLVTAPRKRAAGKGDGKNDGTQIRALEETQGKRGTDRKLAGLANADKSFR